MAGPEKVVSIEDWQRQKRFPHAELPDTEAAKRERGEQVSEDGIVDPWVTVVESLRVAIDQTYRINATNCLTWLAGEDLGTDEMEDIMTAATSAAIFDIYMACPDYLWEDIAAGVVALCGSEPEGGDDG
jgi:hypothetical protein